MNFPLLAVGLPFLGAVGLSVVGGPRVGAIINIAISIAGFVLTLAVWRGGQVGPLAALFGVLSGFIGLTTALANMRLVMLEASDLSAGRWRGYHALFQLLLGLSLLGLYADNIGLLWLALTGETMLTSWGLSLQRTPAALRAAWSYLLLGGVGMGLALFGTMLVYLAVQPVSGTWPRGMGFAALSAHAAQGDQSLLCLGFILILFGYGAKALLAPLNGWLAARHAEGPMVLTYIVQGLFTNVALLAILRFRHVARIDSGPWLPDSIILAFAVASLFFAAFAMARQGNVRRFLGALASQQAAVTLFAFGIGGPMAIFGGLLQMLVQTLLKSGSCLVLIRAVEGRGGDYTFARLRGLPHFNKYLGWVFGAALFAWSGLPPSGLFVGEFIIIDQTILHNPWMCVPLSIGLMLCAMPVLRYTGRVLCAPAPAEKTQKAGWDVNLAVLHLVVLLILAFAMPALLVKLLSAAAVALQ